MEKILLYIKHHLSFLWKIIEWLNGFLFHCLFYTSMQKALHSTQKDHEAHQWSTRALTIDDAEDLVQLIQSQKKSDLKYFSPHGFDIESIKKQFKNKAFLMLGVFSKTQLIGYFFLRFFVSKKCFVGRLIASEYRGQGVGLLMNQLMYKTAWKMGFRCLSTISKNNKLVMKAHRNNGSMVIRKELNNDYLLIEFINLNST